MISFSDLQMSQLLELVKLAGKDILQVYDHPDSIQTITKADSSPLTAADLAAHKRLSMGLKEILDIPLLSEESNPADYQNRHAWDSYWLADPLDGTKEFIARNGQFTVNVALILQGKAVIGVVYQPVTYTCYWGINEHFELTLTQLQPGAWRQTRSQTTQITCESLEERFQKKLPLRALISQHHQQEISMAQLNHLKAFWPAKIETVAVGSSLKVCAIAEGKADVYLRNGPTGEWDTAAAQVVLEAAGGKLVSTDYPYPSFRYNQRHSLLNEGFCAAHHPERLLHWLSESNKQQLNHH